LHSSSVHCESKVTATEAWGPFRNPEKGEILPLEAVTRGVVKREYTKKIQSML
jgi:hypothetical protein